MAVTNETIEPYNHAETEEKWKAILLSSPAFKAQNGPQTVWNTIIDPAQKIARGMFFDYGTDCILLYAMFAQPQQPDLSWGDRETDAVYHFLLKVWRFGNEMAKAGRKENDADAGSNMRMQQLTFRIADAWSRKQYHNITTIFMEEIKRMEKAEEGTAVCEWIRFLRLLSRYAPYITQELWMRMKDGQQTAENVNSLLIETPYPEADPEVLSRQQATIALQVNGKTRTKILVSPGTEKEEILRLAKDALKGREGMDAPSSEYRIIYVPMRIVNFVTPR